MTLKEFKSEAIRRGNVFDNAQNAGKAWMRGWGLGAYWKDLWAFKKFSIGNLTYKTGTVRTRHSSYSVVECFIGDEQVSLSKFYKALDSFVAPDLTDAELNYINETAAKLAAKEYANNVRRARQSAKNNSSQLLLNFEVA